MSARRKNVSAATLPATAERAEVIGYSCENRPLTVRFRGRPEARVRLFALAGQHGDEPEATEAALLFLERYFGKPRDPVIQTAVLADANPDGGIARTRRNAMNIDLNRDHLLLESPEAAAVHSFVQRWKPDIVIDVHTYRPRRSGVLKYGLVFPQDVMVDVPTNPAGRCRGSSALETDLMDFVKARMEEGGWRSDRYTRLRPSGIVRHSNVDILDARNSLAVRHGIVTVLLEGRRAAPGEDEMFRPTHLALLDALIAVAEWAERKSRVIDNWRKRFSRRHAIPVRCEFCRSGGARRMEMQLASDLAVQNVILPGIYLPRVRPTKEVEAPQAYAVPRNRRRVLEILARHGFETVSPDRFKGAPTECYRILGLPPGGESDPNVPLAPVARESIAANLEDYVLFRADSIGGNALALLLEPESQFGLSRFPRLQLEVEAGARYAIVRVN